MFRLKTGDGKRLLAASFFLILGFLTGCGGSGTGLTVTVSPASVVVQAGQTQQFFATVVNDNTNQGVAWSLEQNGVFCSPSCGTLSVATTASGAVTTYIAPSTPMSVTIVATAVADSAISGTGTITIPGGISVVVTPSTVTLGLGVTQTFIASVFNDSSNQGVQWTLTQGGAACSPACGTVSPATSASGASVTYTAPGTEPAQETVKLTAAAVAAPAETAWAIITVQGGVSVAVTPTYVNVPVNGTQTFSATVANDTNSQGVTWKLTQNGAACSPGCGSITASTSSNVSATYTAPSTAMTVTLTATSVANTAETGAATIIVQPVTVAVSPTLANLYPGDTLFFTATVSNDVAEKGVTWTLKQGGTACSPGCGTISPTTTGGGVQTTYTTPSTISTAATVTVIATSVSDTSASASATVNLYPPITVAVTPSTASAAVNSRTTFTATVANDPTQAGVAWTLLQSGTACSPACGTVSPSPTTGNTSQTIYFAPSSVPSSPTVTLQATSSADTTKTGTATITISSSVAQEKLLGSYAFEFSGTGSSGAVAIAGNFTADGAGNITGGTADISNGSGPSVTETLAGTYAIGADNSGSLSLTSAPTGSAIGTFRFLLNATGDRAQFIELDASGTRGAGTLRKQAISSFSPATLTGGYAFSAAGTDANGARLAMAGRFVANGTGELTGVMDSNDAGAVATQTPISGRYTLAASGRGTLEIETPAGTLAWAFYAISPSEVYLVSWGAGSSLVSGRALAQTDANFTASSLDGTSVVALAGGASSGPGSSVVVGLLSFDGAGGVKLQADENNGGSVRQLNESGSYAVSPNGRVTVAVPAFGNPLVSYLVSPGRGLALGSGHGAMSGSFEPQAAGPFSNASLSGSYGLATVAAPAAGSPVAWGTLTVGAPGEIAGRKGGVNAAGALVARQNFAETYAVAPSGRGIAATTGEIFYLISPSRAIVADMRPGASNPTLSEIEK